jgi:uncharacterized protein with PIN domain
VIEACGVPHTEVDLVAELDGGGLPVAALPLSAPLEKEVALAVFPVPAPTDVLPEAPRLQPRACHRFLADGHLGALTRHLRLLGIDVSYDRDADDRDLLYIMQREGRGLLTRDLRLLMHNSVLLGYCPRSDEPEQQAREVLQRFDVSENGAAPIAWSRCLHCNGHLRRVAKEQVLARLADEPRTLRYYEDFRQCEACGRVYWHGSHSPKLRARLERIHGPVSTDVSS